MDSVAPKNILFPSNQVIKIAPTPAGLKQTVNQPSHSSPSKSNLSMFQMKSSTATIVYAKSPTSNQTISSFKTESIENSPESKGISYLI